uniref:Uncharacterized protein n=1 Tax=Panagrolaimus sp. PS1159 TaxID=55785 RepID=A0AC35G469_9BILA
MGEKYFDPLNRKYRCICGCHVTTATKILCWFTIVIAAVSLFSAIQSYPKMTSFFVFLFLIACFFFITPLFAIQWNNHRWMFPIIAITFLSLIVVALENLATLNELLTFGPGKKPFGYHLENDPIYDYAKVLGFILIKSLFTIGIIVWYLLIFIRTYQYLAAKNKAVLLPIQD